MSKVFLFSGINDLSTDQQLKEVLITNPINKSKSCYLFDEKNCQFYEITKQTNDYRSWFVNNAVIEDGNLYIVTPCDLLFIVLPFLVKRRTQFRSLFDLLSDGFDDNISKVIIKSIESALNFELISLIAETKFINEEMFVKFNSESTLKWLKCKVDNIVEALKQKNISVSSDGCKAIGYKTGKEHLNQDNTEYMKTAFELISQYLSEEICADLKKMLGLPQIISDASVSMNLNKQIKRKMNESECSAPIEDYSNYESTKNGSTLDNKRSKLTRSEKELLKVDKTGMKTISSFFKPKTK